MTLQSTTDVDRTMTINIEYNQLDPLLRSTTSPEGDYNDKTTGLSPFPGNINMLLLRLSSYNNVLTACSGVMKEFVNPKYVDSTKRDTFKKPTRLECMMQDIAEEFCSGGFTVGYTLAPGKCGCSLLLVSFRFYKVFVCVAWFSYNPCKNNAQDAVTMVGNGIPGASPLLAESMYYEACYEILRRHGVKFLDSIGMDKFIGQSATDVEEPSRSTVTYLGLTAPMGPRIIIHPSVAVFVSELLTCFPNPSDVVITFNSTLIIHPCEVNSADTSTKVKVHKLLLDGSMDVLCGDRVELSINSSDLIRNPGHEVIDCATNDDQIYKMRGYRMICRGCCVVEAVNADTEIVRVVYDGDKLN